jgi:hypothetical protein
MFSFMPEPPKKPEPKQIRVVMAEAWRYVPAGRRGVLLRQVDDYIWIRLDKPFEGTLAPIRPVYNVKVHASCVRELRILELLAECAE